ncbi:hypothetical protein A2456_00890 [Candidatus Nomurabacteria bacterium RIFOXYC2_FULL_36_19]|uniref:MamI family restriction endonuclease n=1 Tax=Candidatus Nomurabacteria bacterium RIFOXYC2_FULL_36_19 TaxID=1801806 RepID=A0A1F6YS96_9BACT|nr:MAG: hypothetical protein A2238_03470 [Candidatus Nomurabacteria bacterium RIFOXYA2_FULL_35_9]OGJ09261.1 MAG: hypothetical protein A2456_00890 [Candidatus Nomurabacteria bacterium RIFOXYC2_FULL_36_19]
MQPDKKLIKIGNNLAQIKQLLSEIVLQPRINAIKWSVITKQTPNIKIGYPGQHLASLITGMFGERTGARGNDLADGSEVKSCSRIDQLDLCKDCKSPVARSEVNCSSCNSTNILRKDDSKWLFSVKSENDLNVLTKEVKRVLLIMGDYPNFNKGDFNTLRFQAFEIWTNSPRNARFREIMTNYYKNIYLGHKKKNIEKTPAPKNFWPYSYQFYICNPIQTFTCIIKNANSKPKIEILHYVEPTQDRSRLASVIMPSVILSDLELELIFKNSKSTEIIRMIKPEFKSKLGKIKNLSIKEKRVALIGIDETLRSYLPLRDTDKISSAKNQYSRRIN